MSRQEYSCMPLPVCVYKDPMPQLCLNSLYNTGTPNSLHTMQAVGARKRKPERWWDTAAASQLNRPDQSERRKRRRRVNHGWRSSADYCRVSWKQRKRGGSGTEEASGRVCASVGVRVFSQQLSAVIKVKKTVTRLNKLYIPECFSGQKKSVGVFKKAVLRLLTGCSRKNNQELAQRNCHNVISQTLLGKTHLCGGW